MAFSFPRILGAVIPMDATVLIFRRLSQRRALYPKYKRISSIWHEIARLALETALRLAPSASCSRSASACWT